MDINADEVTINGITYTVKGSEQETVTNTEGKRYVLVRTQNAGVFAGYLDSKSADGLQVTLLGSRRIYYWAGAASLSQLAIDGTSKPKECKFPTPELKKELTQVIEISDVTAKAKKSIESVPVWKA